MTIRPIEREPLVYHLFGIDEYSKSLVLTEDDYLDFLVDVSEGRGNNSQDRIPGVVRAAIDRDLLVLGYSLNSWAFRAIYAGLIKPDGTHHESRGVCNVQVLPSEEELAYLNDYLQHEARFDVFEGDLHAYAQMLRNL